MALPLRTGLALLVVFTGALLALGLEQAGVTALVAQLAVAPLVLVGFGRLLRFERCLACLKLQRRDGLSRRPAATDVDAASA
jgi:hypothetical protein